MSIISGRFLILLSFTYGLQLRLIMSYLFVMASKSSYQTLVYVKHSTN